MDYCMSCFGWPYRGSDEERGFLLPRHVNTVSRQQRRHVDPLPAERPEDKLVDVLVGLNQGKLPSQEQLARFFQFLLRSDLLCEDINVKVLPGKGPMSVQGLKVLGDAREVVQALLQFGMEKNDDDKVQEMLFQISQIQGVPIRVDVDVVPTFEAGHSVWEAGKAGTEQLKKEAPAQGELVSDAAIVLDSLKTLFHALVTSSVFRFLLIDALSIARELIAHAAVDVENAAETVRDAAEDVEKKAKEDDVDIGVEGIKGKGKEVADSMLKGGRKVREEWEGVATEVEDESKARLVKRLQELIVRAQHDRSCRMAIHAILILVHKYADKLSTISETVSSSAADAASASTSNYPPQPYVSTSPNPQIDVDVTSPSLERAMGYMKTLLERTARGRSSEPLLRAFKQVLLDIGELPLEVAEKVQGRAEKLSDEEKFEPEEKEEDGEEHRQEDSMDALEAKQPGSDDAGDKKRKRKNRKSKGGKGKGEASPMSPEDNRAGDSPHNGPTKPPNGQPSSSPSHKVSGNPVRAYFDDVNFYLERALSEPGWAASPKGTQALEKLLEMGADLTSMAGEVVDEAIGIGDMVESGAEGDPDAKRQEKEPNVKQRFGQDLQKFINELDVFARAMEADRTTMRLINAFRHLGTDVTNLLSKEVVQGQQKAKKTARRGLLGLGLGASWTQWLIWGLPRLMKMIPPSWIPVPRIEVKTPSVEGALDALWLRGDATGRRGGVSGKLLPDELLVREWTELRVNMSDERDEGMKDAWRQRDVQTTSRIRLHMDGIRAFIQGMGYYLRYKGTLIGYEDEGVLSIDVGANGAKGVVMDVEVEVDSSSEVLENVWQEDRIRVGVIPQIIVEGENNTPNESANGMPTNLDVQRAGSKSSGVLVAGGAQPPIGPALAQPVEPLFRVVDVHFDVEGMQFTLDQSRHWLLNKLVVQPLAGDAVTRIVKSTVEDKMKEKLGWLAAVLGRLGAEIRERGRRRRALNEEMRRRREALSGEEIEEEEDVIGDLLADWWGALVEKGPEAFGYSKLDEDEDDDTETSTKLQPTMKGVVYTSTTTTHQPIQSPDMTFDVPPDEMANVDVPQQVPDFPQTEPLVAEGHTETETVVAVGAAPQLFPDKGGPYGGRNDEEHEAEGERRQLIDAVRDTVVTGVDGMKRGVDAGIGAVKRGEEGVQRASNRKKLRHKVESKSSGWRSGVFDF